MAGLGQRFKNQGVLTPKPLIEIQGHPLFYHSLLSLKPILSHSRISFVVCQEDEIGASIKQKMGTQTIPFQVLTLESRTKGPAETLFLTKDFIHLDKPLLSLDCDLFFQSPAYFESIQSTDTKKDSGYLCYFQSTAPKYSYIAMDEAATVCEIAEKKVISNNAVIGSYFFSSAEAIMDSIEKLSLSKGELFLSLAIQDMIMRGQTFKAFPSVDYLSFGTPEELRESLPFVR